VHVGVERGLPSAIEAAKAYRANPRTDFHALVGEMTGLGRDNAKTANFAKGLRQAAWRRSPRPSAVEGGSGRHHGAI